MVDFLMRHYVEFLQKDNEEGQGLAEYALILALIAILAVAALLFLGDAIQEILSDIGDALNNRGA